MPAHRSTRRQLLALVTTAWTLAACPTHSTMGTTTHRAPQVFHVARSGSDQATGTESAPWATVHHAARTARAGDRVLIHGGTYPIDAQIQVRHRGTEDAWIVFAAAENDTVVIDASALRTSAPQGRPPFDHDQGAFQIEGVAYVRVQGLTIRRAQRAGITIRDSHNIAIIDNTIEYTFSSGIAAWDTDRNGEATHHIEVRGNTVAHANTFDMLPKGWPRSRYTPHEAISIAGARHFEVSENHVHHGGKEGIDVKGNSRHGRVHHNHVHDCAHQGLYVDGWFDTLSDVEFDHNDVHNNRGAGIVVSVEDGPAVEDIRIHDNDVYDNDGAGVFFSRWAGDGPRRNIIVEHNTIRGNGFGTPKEGRPYYWMTGGIFVLSANVRDLQIRGNVVTGNQAFQIGVSGHVAAKREDLDAALAERGIVIDNNVVEQSLDAAGPIDVGDAEEDRVGVWPVAGQRAREPQRQ